MCARENSEQEPTTHPSLRSFVFAFFPCYNLFCLLCRWKTPEWYSGRKARTTYSLENAHIHLSILIALRRTYKSSEWGTLTRGHGTDATSPSKMNDEYWMMIDVTCHTAQVPLPRRYFKLKQIYCADSQTSIHDSRRLATGLLSPSKNSTKRRQERRKDHQRFVLCFLHTMIILIFRNVVLCE